MAVKYSDWDIYSNDWNKRIRESGIKYLGDEWGDGTLFPIPDYLSKILSPTSRVLEIGSGGGRITNFILDITKDVTVCDISREMLVRVISRFPGVESFLIASFDWEIPDDSFDAVVAYDVMVHMEAADIFHYLGEIKRILRVGGQALLHVANTESEAGFREWVRMLKGHKLGYRPYTSFGCMSRKIFRNMALMQGFSIVSEELIGGRDWLFVIEANQTGRIR